MHVCRKQVRLAISNSRLLATTTATPPRASPDQIFLSDKAAKAGSSIATEDDWIAAVRALEESQNREVDPGISGPGDASLFARNRVGQIGLPTKLTRTVNSILEQAHGPHIRSTALRFYESLNPEKPSKIPMPLSKDFSSIEADAYLAGLMPQLFISVNIVLLELRKRLGRDWNPKTVLDCGIGPGTAALAFNEVYYETNPHASPERPQITIIEPNRELRKRAETIWTQYQSAHDVASKESSTTEDSLKFRIFHKMGDTGHKYDLVLAPHNLTDFHGRPSDRDLITRDLWSRLNPGGVILLLERGNPLGFEKIAHARQILLYKHTTSSNSNNHTPSLKSQSHGHVIAPCPGDGKCPLYSHGHQPARRQWCHFSQRLQRPDYLQLTRHSKYNIEDVNYSYVLLRKGMSRPVASTAQKDEVAEPKKQEEEEVSTDELAEWKGGIVTESYRWPRIILPPLKRHKHVLIDVCSPAANDSDKGTSDDPILQRHVIPKSQGIEEYKFARRSHWGDLVPFDGKTILGKEGHVDVNKMPSGRGDKSKNHKSKRLIETDE